MRIWLIIYKIRFYLTEQSEILQLVNCSLQQSSMTKQSYYKKLGGTDMRRRNKQRYDELYKENLSTLKNDVKEMEKIEQRIDKKHMDRLGS